MKRIFTYYLIALTLMVLLTGCASIIHGTKQNVVFTSQPPGAKITIDGIEYGTTPKSVELSRKGRLKGESSGKKEYAVKIEMEGYYPYEIKITRELDGLFFGNLLLGGIVGMIIDAGSGAMFKLTPDQLVAHLGRSTSMNVSNSEDEIYLAVAMDIDPSWEQIGTMEKIK